MARKKNKKKAIIGGLIIVGIAVILMISFGVFQGIIGDHVASVVINGEAVGIEKGEITLNGIEGMYETPYLGSANSQKTADLTISINGNNDPGDIGISNALDGGDELFMKTSSGGKNEVTNYLKTTFTLPPGNITINCKTTASGDDDNGQSECWSSLGGTIASTSSPRGGVRSGLANKWLPKDITKQYVLEKEKEVTFRTRTYSCCDTSKGGIGKGTVEMTIQFTPEAVEQTETTTETGNEQETNNQEETSGGQEETSQGTTQGNDEDKPSIILGVGIAMVVIILIIIILVGLTRRKKR